MSRSHPSDPSVPAPAPAAAAEPTSLFDLVQHLAEELVDESSEVSVKEITGATTTVYEVSVAKSDVGKLIGRSGRTLRAYRTIVSAVSTKLHRKAILEIIE